MYAFSRYLAFAAALALGLDGEVLDIGTVEDLLFDLFVPHKLAGAGVWCAIVPGRGILLEFAGYFLGLYDIRWLCSMCRTLCTSTTHQTLCLGTLPCLCIAV